MSESSGPKQEVPTKPYTTPKGFKPPTLGEQWRYVRLFWLVLTSAALLITFAHIAVSPPADLTPFTASAAGLNAQQRGSPIHCSLQR